MTDEVDGPTGWKELSIPTRSRRRREVEDHTAAESPSPGPGETPERPPIPDTPFMRLARVHAASVAADAMVVVALANSLFFDIDPDAARWRILLYLLLTMAPFAVVGPFIGPALDRVSGGRRRVIMGITGLRIIAALLMIPYVNSLLLFPVAFAHLVLGKSYAVAKASIVPETVRTDAELVERNSRLAILSGVAGFVGAGPAVVINYFAGATWALALAGCMFALALWLARELPQVTTPEHTPEETEVGEMELRGRTILFASSAMSVLRGVVGFMFWMVAFAFRGGTDQIDLSPVGKSLGAGIRTALGYPVVDEGVTAAWKLGVIVACSLLGGLAGNLLAPRLRERYDEENMLLGALVAVLGSAVLSTWVGGLNGAGLMALSIGAGAAVAKIAFDTIVQRDAPDADYATSFAGFETRFQIAWVIGAVIPVILRIPPRLGFFIIALATLFAAASFYVAARAEGSLPDLAGRFAARRAGSRGNADGNSDNNVGVRPGEPEPHSVPEWVGASRDPQTRTGDPARPSTDGADGAGGPEGGRSQLSSQQPTLWDD